MSKPCGIQSNALDKSIKTDPVKRSLSSDVFQFSMSPIKTLIVLHPFLCAEMKSDKNPFEKDAI